MQKELEIFSVLLLSMNHVIWRSLRSKKMQQSEFSTMSKILSSEFQFLFRFFEIIKVGECFTISNGVLKNKNAQYNNTGSDYELTLGRTSIIESCDGDDE